MLFTAFILGLLGSFHCIGMCGPIAFMLPVSRENKLKKFFQIFLYHGGRLFAYSTIGLVFGLVGKSLNLFGMQQQLSIFIGILMILVILLPTAKFNKYNFSTPISKYLGKLKSSLGAAFKKKTPDTFFTIGFLNGLLPCGLVYLAVFGAVGTGSILNGSTYMLLFGLGTIPLMTTAVYFSNMLNSNLRLKIRKLVPVFVVIIGTLFILRGLGLGIPYVSPLPVDQKVTATLNCH